MNHSPSKTSLSLRISLFFFLIFVADALATFVFSQKGLDTLGFSFAATLSSDQVTKFFYVMTLMGQEEFLIPATVCIVAGTFFYRLRTELVTFLIALAGGQLIKEILKEIIDRPRPSGLALIELPTSMSFPSGHAMNSVVFFGLICYFLWRNYSSKTLNLWITGISIFLILAISFSRVYLGVHYASDILAGVSLGASWVFLIGHFYDRRVEQMKTKQQTTTISTRF